MIAPGAGVVVAAQDGVADNVPGEMNPAQAMGNHVIIDHGKCPRRSSTPSPTASRCPGANLSACK